jgi:adenylate cyclase
MPREIERKFLVRGDEWASGAEGTPYRQGYLSTDAGRTVRVRVAGGRAMITIKGPSAGAVRAEYEYDIPAADATEIIDTLCLSPVIVKDRHTVNYHGKKWVIDVFGGENEGLILAEIELASEDEPFDLPPWAGEEVTGDGRFSNASLVERPFRTWEK